MMLNKFCTDVSYDHLGRVYHFNDGSKYHSVTTMLAKTANKKGIEKWRKKVGEKEADRISKVAAHLGEQYHLMGEYFLRRKHTPRVNVISNHIFNSTREILAKHVTDVHAVEAQLFSDELKLAGRVDAVVDWEGQLAILDFKLLNNSDKRWLNDYWIQTTVYAHCWNELYGELPKRLVLVIGNKNSLDTIFYTSRTLVHQSNMHHRVFSFNTMLKHSYF